MPTNRSENNSNVPFATDYGCQQVKGHSGYLVNGRYYLRPRGPKPKSFGLGYSLGNNPFVVAPHAANPASRGSTPEANSPTQIELAPELAWVDTIWSFFRSQLEHLFALIVVIYFFIVPTLRASGFYFSTGVSKLVLLMSSTRLITPHRPKKPLPRP